MGRPPSRHLLLCLARWATPWRPLACRGEVFRPAARQRRSFLCAGPICLELPPHLWLLAMPLGQPRGSVLAHREHLSPRPMQNYWPGHGVLFAGRKSLAASRRRLAFRAPRFCGCRRAVVWWPSFGRLPALLDAIWIAPSQRRRAAAAVWARPWTPVANPSAFTTALWISDHRAVVGSVLSCSRARRAALAEANWWSC